MTTPRLPMLGDVVWADVPDANGIRKVRPTVVVSVTADIAAGQPVRLAAVTTRLPNPLPDDHVILPWDRQGKARSGLRQRCAAVASWIVTVPSADVREIVGALPPKTIAELLAKIAASTLPPAPSEDTGDAPLGEEKQN